MVDALLLDEIVSPIRRENFADPIRAQRDGDSAGPLGHAFSPPTDDIRTEDIRRVERNVHLGGEPPSTGPTSPVRRRNGVK